MSRNIKRKTRPDEWPLLLLLALIIGLFNSCTTRIEGCLDPDASNFDLGAEKACVGCCTYPTLAVSLSQKWDDRNFNTADTLMDMFQRPYQIIDLKYFISSWSWRDQDGQLHTVDSSTIMCGQGNLTFTNDIAVVDSRQFNYTLGTIRGTTSIDSLEVFLGLTEDFSCIDDNDPGIPASLTSSSALWNSQTGELNTMRLVLRRDLEEAVMDTLFVKEVMQHSAVYFPFVFVRGSNAQLRMSVDYARWFSLVDITDLNSFSESIHDGFEGSIFKTP